VRRVPQARGGRADLTRVRDSRFHFQLALGFTPNSKSHSISLHRTRSGRIAHSFNAIDRVAPPRVIFKSRILVEQFRRWILSVL